MRAFSVRKSSQNADARKGKRVVVGRLAGDGREGTEGTEGRSGGEGGYDEGRANEARTLADRRSMCDALVALHWFRLANARSVRYDG